MRDLATPAELYGDLFYAVQRAGVFPDSKDFADAIPCFSPQAIVKAYRDAAVRADFDLSRFVHDHFSLPAEPPSVDPPRRGRVVDAIDATWNSLTRQPADSERSSLISLPFPYLVPGGRFREIYYWDSYFTMLGLAASGRVDLIEAMVKNFVWLIDAIGHVPNGNRTYYCSRSQPPFLALMVTLLARLRGDDILELYRPALLSEYEFWMAGSDALGGSGSAVKRVVSLDGSALNRFWDARNSPREESYREDLARADGSPSSPTFFRDVRAACESGWDFSSRWLAEADQPDSLRTTQLIPVDLNCLLYYLETVLARASARAGRDADGRHFTALAQARARILRSRFYDSASGLFTDLLLPSGAASPMESLAMVYPLAFGIATEAQAASVASVLAARYRYPGGWITSPRESGLQWDAPSGWAPLQWFAYLGLQRYGHHRLALEVARSWVDSVVADWRLRGVFLERYDVASPGQVPGGGEYPTQTGFGWTNGVLRALLAEPGMHTAAG